MHTKRGNGERSNSSNRGTELLPSQASEKKEVKLVLEEDEADEQDRALLEDGDDGNTSMV